MRINSFLRIKPTWFSCVVLTAAFCLSGQLDAAETKMKKPSGLSVKASDHLKSKTRKMSPEEVEKALKNRVKTLKKGSSQRAARKQSLKLLPLEQMTPANKKKAEKVVESLSLYRELPTLSVEVKPKVYRFFVQHPDVAVSIWRVMQISEFQMWQTGPDAYEADTGDGTLGVIDVLLRSDTDNVIYCEGTFKSPFLLKAIEAKSVLHLQTSFNVDANGKEKATHRLHMYVSFPSQKVETVARLISPVSNQIVDRNFVEITLFLNMMSVAMTRQPGWVDVVAQRMDGVLKSRKHQLLAVMTKVHREELEKELKQGNPTTRANNKGVERNLIQTTSGLTSQPRR